MTAVSPIPPKPTPVRHYENAAEWLHALGDVPPERIVMDPPPGTATEGDLIQCIDGDDKRLVELIDGTLVEKPVGTKESYIASLLATALNNFILPRKLGIITGEAGPYRVASRRVRLPDIAFISVANLAGGKVPDEAIASLTPSLAIEIISRGNTKKEMRQKLTEYFGVGVQLVWFIYLNSRTVAVFEADSDSPTRTLSDRDALDGGRVLPGFSFPVAGLFENIA